MESESLLALINPGNEELVELWALALAEVGGIYATMGTDGRLALAAGAVTLVRTLLDGSALSESMAARYVAPPPYRDQPASEFILASLTVASRITAWLETKTTEPRAAEAAGRRLRAVLADASSMVVRLREQHQGRAHLLQSLGTLFSSAGSARETFAHAAERIALDLGVDLCFIATLDDESVRLYAAHPPARTLALPVGEAMPRAQFPWLDFVEPDVSWHRPLNPEDPGFEGRLAGAGFTRLVAHPLLAAGRLMGVVGLASRGPMRERVSEPMRIAAPLIAAALAQVRQAGALDQAEAALTEVFDNAPTMMCALDRLGRVVRTSRRFRDELGLPDDCLGMPLQWLVHPAWMERFNVLWSRIRAERFIDQARVDLITAHGARLSVSLEGRWLQDELGEPAVCMLGLWNIAALLAREQAQRARIDELNAFAHQVAHDLKAPLRTVAGFAAMLSEELPPDTGAELQTAVARIRAAAERGDAMVEGILRYARSGGVGKAMPVRVALLVENVREALAADLDASGGQIVIVRDDSALLGDIAALTTLLANLIGNAIRYRADAAPSVEVGVTALSPGWATLSVKDNGMGIEPEDQGRVFELFQRASTSRTGTGVGLAIVRRVARAHGGEVEVTSTQGQGSMFSVRLPTA